MITKQRKFKVFFIYQSKHNKSRYSKMHYIGAKTANQALLRAKTFIGIGRLVDVQLAAN